MFLIANGERFSGFDKMVVFQSMETISDAFHFESKLMPNEIKANIDVQIFIGNQLRISGRTLELDKRRSENTKISGGDYSLTLKGAFANNSTGEFIKLTLKEIITTLVSPFGLSVDGEDGPTLKKYNYSLDDPINDIIADLCTRTAFIVSSTPEGNLTISDATAAEDSGITLVEGQNISDMALNINMQKRFSEYNIYAQNKHGAFQNSDKVFSSVAGTTRTHRPFNYFNSNQFEIADADKEAAWRKGYSDGMAAVYTVETPSILNIRPNQLITIDSTYLGVQDSLLVLDVKFVSKKDKLKTELTLVSPSTFGGREVENEFIG